MSYHGSTQEWQLLILTGFNQVHWNEAAHFSRRRLFPNFFFLRFKRKLLATQCICFLFRSLVLFVCFWVRARGWKGFTSNVCSYIRRSFIVQQEWKPLLECIWCIYFKIFVEDRFDGDVLSFRLNRGYYDCITKATNTKVLCSNYILRILIQ